jgi:hypothetical protein
LLSLPELTRAAISWSGTSRSNALLEETASTLALSLRERRFVTNPVRSFHQQLALAGYVCPMKSTGKVAEAAAELFAEQR